MERWRVRGLLWRAERGRPIRGRVGCLGKPGESPQLGAGHTGHYSQNSVEPNEPLGDNPLISGISELDKGNA